MNWSALNNASVRFSRFIYKHWSALLLALAMGLLSVGPYVYFEHTPAYKGITFIGHDAEEHYIARIHEIYKGDILLHNVYLPHKDVPYLEPSLGEALVALIGKILGVSAPAASIVAKLVFPFLVFIFLYTLAYSVYPVRLVALCAASLAMISGDILNNPADILHVFMGYSNSYGFAWSRPINPQVSSLFLFSGLTLIYLRFIVQRHVRMRSIIAIGVIAGLTLYVSIYMWAFLGALLVTMCVWHLLQKRYEEMRGAITAGLIALAVSTPFFVNLVHAKTYPGYAAAALETGVTSSHTPILGLWVLLLILVPLFVFRQTFKNERWLFTLSGIALVGCLNQQVITGLSLQPGHFHWYITRPLIGLMAGIYGYESLKKLNERFSAGVSVFGIMFCIAYITLSQAHFYRTHVSSGQAAQAYMPVITYLNNTEHQVVFANSKLSDYVAIYTNDDTPNDGSAPLYIAPVHYFDALSTFSHSLASSTPGASTLAQQLGITLLVRDMQEDTWPGVGSKIATINNRFEIYSVGTTASKK